MDKRHPFSILFLLTAFLFSVALEAQTTVTVQVKEDGKIVKDTTYQFDDADVAKQAVKMMEVMGHSGDHTNTMVFISEDGKTTEITEYNGDSLAWVSEEDHDGTHVKVMKYKVEGDGDKIVEKKNIKIIIMEGEEGDQQVIEKEIEIKKQ
jgi:hypothetical protein